MGTEEKNEAEAEAGGLPVPVSEWVREVLLFELLEGWNRPTTDESA